MIKNILKIIMVFFLFFTSKPLLHNAFAKEEKKLDISAPSVILMEASTGEILYEKDPNEKLPPASMTKMMTMLLVMEAIENNKLRLDDVITVSEYASSMGGSQIFLAPGEEMTVSDLLKGVAIASGNDASVALAEKIAGSEKAFVDLMNQKAKDLRLKNTHFTNSSGLPNDKQYSTSYDMAVIAKELLKHEAILEYTSIYEDYLRKGKKNEFWLVNTNKLIRTYPGLDGLKTGYTTEAKYCLAATAERERMRLITVVMGAESVKERTNAVTTLLNYGFNQYETHELYRKNDVVEEIKLLKGNPENVNIITKNNIKILQAKMEQPKDIQTKVILNDTLQLPLHSGEKVGSLLIIENNQTKSTYDLTIDQNIKPANIIHLTKRMLQKMTYFH